MITYTLLSSNVLSCSVISDFLWPHQAPLSMGTLQASILELVVMPSSKGSSQPKDWTQVSHIAGRFFTIWANREVPYLALINSFSSSPLPCLPCLWCSDDHSFASGRILKLTPYLFNTPLISFKAILLSGNSRMLHIHPYCSSFSPGYRTICPLKHTDSF